MPLYVAPLLGVGTDADPFRPPVVQPGSGFIDLRADSTQPGRGLLYLPTPVSLPGLQRIADELDHIPEQAERAVLGARFGVVPQALRANEVIAELLLDHGRNDGTRWKPLRPSKVRQQYEIFLGNSGRIWSKAQFVPPSTTSFTETWPTDSSTLSSGQDQPWTETDNNLSVSSGVLRPLTFSALINRARCDTVLDTDDHEHYATFICATRDSNQRRGDLQVRFDTASTTFYQAAARRDSDGDLRYLQKVVSGTITDLGTNTTDPGTGVVLYCSADGSTITMKLGGTIIHEVTDTAITGHVRVGVALRQDTDAGAYVGFDNHTAADLVAAAGHPAGRRTGAARFGRPVEIGRQGSQVF